MDSKLISLFILTCLTSCSFNSMFYQADKMPPGIKKATITLSTKDSTWITIMNIGANFQPTFTDTNNNVLPFDYTIESIVFKNESGNDLNGWLIKPKKYPNPDITILFLHGNGGNITTQYPAAAKLAEQGFQVFIPDYSGYGFSEGKPTRENVLDDADDALKFLRSRPDVKNTKVVIYGQSLGGHLAAVAAQKNEQVIDGVVMEGAFSSHKDIAVHYFGFAGRALVKEKYSAFRSIRHFHKPVLLIHSDEDKVVPISMGRKIYSNANEPKTFYEIKHGHIQGPIFYSDSIAYKIRAMVAKQ